jgi:hypothetical protein
LRDGKGAEEAVLLSPGEGVRIHLACIVLASPTSEEKTGNNEYPDGGFQESAVRHDSPPFHEMPFEEAPRSPERGNPVPMRVKGRKPLR